MSNFQVCLQKPHLLRFVFVVGFCTVKLSCISDRSNNSSVKFEEASGFKTERFRPIDCSEEPGSGRPKNPLLLEHPSNSELGKFSFDLCNGVSFAAIQNFAETESFESGTEFLQGLKNDERFSGFFRNYVLMYSSRSGEGVDVSVLYPRVLSYQDAVTMAWTGEIFDGTKRVDRHGELFVFLEFDTNEMSFVPHSIDFSSGAAVFDSNVEDCSSCHGDPMRPIWESYHGQLSHWLGAIDQFDSSAKPKSVEIFKTFSQSLENRSDKRYGLLMKDVYFDSQTQRHFRSQPSLKFTHYLHTLNAERVMAHLEKLPNHYEYAIAGAKRRCNNVEEFFLDTKERSLSQMKEELTKNLSDRKKWVLDALKQDSQKVVLPAYDTLERNIEANYSDLGMPGLEHLAYVLQDSAFPVTHWTLDFIPAKPHAASFRSWQGNFNLKGSSNWKKKRNKLSGYLYERYVIPFKNMSCEELATKSKNLQRS